MNKPDSFYVPVNSLNALLPENQLLMFAVSLNIRDNWLAIIRTPYYYVPDAITEKIMDLAEKLEVKENSQKSGFETGSEMDNLFPDNQVLMFAVAFDFVGKRMVVIRAPYFIITDEAAGKIIELAEKLELSFNSMAS